MNKLNIEKLHEFKNHPYKVQDNEEMEQLTESIMHYGVIAPIVVRPKENTTDEYEIISGHRRVMACRKAGIEEVPALVVSMDRDAAAIALVDSNLHREHVLPNDIQKLQETKAELEKKQSEQNSMSRTALEIIPTTQHILDNYDALSPAQKNVLWKLVLKKVSVYRSEPKKPFQVKIYPNLPQ